MKKTTIKPSGIATVAAWGGVKVFVLGPAGIKFHARAEKGNKYTVSCQLNLDEIKKEIFSYSFDLTEEEFECADERFSVEDVLRSEDLDSLVAQRLAHDIFYYFFQQSELPITELKDFNDEEFLALCKGDIHNLIQKRMKGEALY